MDHNRAGISPIRTHPIDSQTDPATPPAASFGRYHRRFPAWVAEPYDVGRAIATKRCPFDASHDTGKFTRPVTEELPRKREC